MITITKAEYAALLAGVENAEELAILAEQRDQPTISHDNLKRILAGENPVTVWREEQGLTQRALAEKAGIAPSMINAIEKGTKSPSLDTARRIATALGLGLDDLFG